MKLKLPFQLTPGRRFAFAFWTGWGFHMACDIIAKLSLNSEWIAVTIVSVLAFILLIVYSLNKVSFEKEHNWMLLKNPERK